MTLAWTTEQILELAPDASAASAGRGLATVRYWRALGQDEQAVWGECQGSGSMPYQTQIDLTEPAFRCTCPSRKFPCKHSLGLFLIAAEQPTACVNTTPPAWVTAWLTAREQRATPPARHEGDSVPPAGPTTLARRVAGREMKVRAGLEDLERWLRDLVHHGLATVQGKPYSFWDTPAARLVDAQAPGLARMVRDLAGCVASGVGWQERLMAHLGLLYLAVEGYKRLASLPAATQADLRTLIGWAQRHEDVLATTGILDSWLILGRRVVEEDRLRVQRTWLWGQQQEQAALVLDFAYGQQPLDKSLSPGMRMDAELVFYPGASPLRALVKMRRAPATALTTWPGVPTILAATRAYATALARNPWLRLFPLILQAVTVLRRPDGTWSVRDAAGHSLPLTPHSAPGWSLLALSGGHPLGLCGEWDGVSLFPVSAWVDDRLVVL